MRYQTIPLESPLRDRLFEPLGEFWIRLELAGVAREHHFASPSVSTNQIPASEIIEENAEIFEARKTYRGLISALDFELGHVATNDWLRISQNTKRVRETLGVVLQDQSTDAYANVIRFRERWWYSTSNPDAAVSFTSLRRRILRQGTATEASAAAATARGSLGSGHTARRRAR